MLPRRFPSVAKAFQEWFQGVPTASPKRIQDVSKAAARYSQGVFKAFSNGIKPLPRRFPYVFKAFRIPRVVPMHS